MLLDCHPNEKWRLWVVWVLEQAGHECREISRRAGDNVPAIINDTIPWANIALILFSDTYLSEVGEVVVDACVSAQNLTTIPVLCSPCTLPAILNSIQAVTVHDLFEEQAQLVIKQACGSDGNRSQRESGADKPVFPGLTRAEVPFAVENGDIEQKDVVTSPLGRLREAGQSALDTQIQFFTGRVNLASAVIFLIAVIVIFLLEDNLFARMVALILLFSDLVYCVSVISKWNQTQRKVFPK